MLTVREDREVLAGFGCRYIITRRTWLLMGFLPVWQVKETRKVR